MQSYTHITLEERESLVLLRMQGLCNSQIAQSLGRSRSTISREIRRNQNKDSSYTPWGATCRYLHRRKACVRKLRLESDHELAQFAAERLTKYWPPEAIVAKWKQAHKGAKLSAMTLYQGLRMGLIKGCTVKENLQRRGKRRYARGVTATIKPDRLITERCEEANLRLEVGHFEGDTVYGSKMRSYLVTLVDRKSRYALASIIPKASAENVRKTLVELLSGHCARTLTLDNGAEFARFREVEEATNVEVYFAHPRSPWERGTNENTNGKLRFFFPKPTDFNAVSQTELDEALYLLNTRPRKCLGWLSPYDVFFSKCCT